jgi:hypothetical protein
MFTVRGGADGGFCPLMNFWWSIGQLDSTAFLVTLANASRVINQSYPDEPKESPEAVELYTRSIQCLRKRLQTSAAGVSEGVIITVLEMAYYDVSRPTPLKLIYAHQWFSFWYRIFLGGLSTWLVL